MTLAPEQVGPLLGTEARVGELEIVVDTARLRGVLSKPLAAIETAPVDATFAVDGASVSVVPSTPGRKADLEAVGDAIARGSHRVTAPVVEKQPAHDTAWARKLNITELVSSFTTHYPCCPPRVANIKRAVATLDGAIVEPGEVFSLNERLGPRTAEKGYVKAPAIAGDLSYFEDYGGGVSQVSTTLFNATFFGGYEDVSHAAHSLYISRYPMGREATINWPGLDNKFRNDSKSGVLIKAWAGSTSITVSYYGNKEGRTVRAEGPNILETIEPTTEYVEDPTVPPDEEREVQSGYRGYVVENFRIISRPGREDVRQRFVVRYSMRPRKIARAPAPRAPDPAHPPRPGAPSPKPTSPTTEPPST
ncbi:MAG: VanW family protein, partial [Acidimicrobiia bacterium]|nr:VanW family protein [Acidimicrobiia bacterium]